MNILTRRAGLRNVLHSASRITAISVFVLAPFPLGSVDLVWICVWTVLLVFSLLTADLGGTSREQVGLLLPLFATIAMIGGIVTLQAWPDPPIGPADPVWELPTQFLGLTVPNRISMTAAGPWLAFGYPLLLSLAFVRAVFLATDAKAAQQLLRILAWAGCAYAVYGISAQIADPGTLLFTRIDVETVEFCECRWSDIPGIFSIDRARRKAGSTKNGLPESSCHTMTLLNSGSPHLISTW